MAHSQQVSQNVDFRSFLRKHFENKYVHFKVELQIKKMVN